MKNLLFLLAITTCFISCTAVKFEEPQPAGTAALSQFPEKMQGTFSSGDEDTLKIFRDSFVYFDGKVIDLRADLSASTAVLKKVKNKYILSLQDNGSWDVFPIKVSGNSLLVYYADLDGRTERLLNAESSANVSEVRTADDEFDHYLVKPSDKEFRRLLRKKLFSEKVEFRRIK